MYIQFLLQAITAVEHVQLVILEFILRVNADVKQEHLCVFCSLERIQDLDLMFRHILLTISSFRHVTIFMSFFAKYDPQHAFHLMILLIV